MAGVASTNPAVLEMMRQQEEARARANAPQQQQPASMTAMNTVTSNQPMNNQAGPIGQYYADPSHGVLGAYTPNPQLTTNQYQTGAGGGTEVSGKGSISGGAYEGQQQSQLDAQLKQTLMDKNAKLQADAEARRLGYLSTITGTQQPNVTRGGVGPIDEAAARAAAFGRAKEQAGQTALASLKAISDVMASRGLTGSSVEGNAISDVVGNAAGGVNNFTRDQLMLDLNRAADVADQTYQGNITQRGQNLSMVPSLMGLITAGGGSLY